MRSDFTQRGKSGKRNVRRLRGRWLSVVLLLVFVFGGIGYFVYQHKNHPERFSIATSFFTSVTHWFSERKQHLHQGIEKVKQMTKNQETTPEQIHFDFYTALPAMQMPASVATNENLDTQPTSHSTPKTVKPDVQKPTNLAAERALFDPTEIEQDFSNQLTHSQKTRQKQRKTEQG